MPELRISPQDAYNLSVSGDPLKFVFIDVRNPKAWAQADQKLPGAIRLTLDELQSRLPELDRNATIVTYCT